MKSNILTEVLVEQAGGVREEDVIQLSREGGGNTCLFACVGDEMMSIDRLTAVECRHEVVIATTDRGERYILAYEDVRAIRISPPKKKTSIV